MKKKTIISIVVLLVVVFGVFVITKFAGAELAAMVVGAKVPCVLSSRGDSTKTKMYSIALSALSCK